VKKRARRCGGERASGQEDAAQISGKGRADRAYGHLSRRFTL
jgi:hypothetical protein